ncbi:chemotaxis protein CheR [Anabaena sp. UHCC 0187]|uniref:CheR family methyltransferase n=1 Tax=Anabaena sp. UHCC 0187 TaxID=2590018 RepID=UPI001444B1DA|nr:CheR family methyltransferase [Anabaena sp. UHCC 0187]MTJ11775.1 chemotaxis protein CheR [Anabaena sp. UHCC 0187]
MSCLEIENLLRKKIGIDANIIGSRKIVKAVETRRVICGVSNINDYLQILQNSTEEFNELVELIVVPETWFFRDSQPYHALINYVNSQWLNKFHHSKLRLLSVPCSTGEEPYSLAMTLLDLGLKPTQFHIDAIDISNKSLAKARRGIYSCNSFRGHNLEFQSRYFKPINKEYQISDYVKTSVNFSQGNLLDSQFLLNRQSYDIILCRNVLIYFDSLSRKITLKSLNRLLKTAGLILVGASETGELANLGLEIIRLDGVFVGRKKLTNTENTNLHYSSLDDHKPKEHKKYLTPAIKSTQIPQVSLENSQINNNQNIENKNIATKVTERIDHTLNTIRNLANEGNLTEAASQCQSYLYNNSTNAEAYLLLGEIYQAQKRELQAEECFQKAIYLDPKNSEALLHLTLLTEERGDISKAKILRQRLQRLQQL